LKSLASLKLYIPKGAGSGLKLLAHSKNLTALYLDPYSESNVVLNDLAELKNLTKLSLSGDQVTDEWLRSIRNLDNLTTLELLGTKVTDSRIEGLRKALPKCAISRERLPH